MLDRTAVLLTSLVGAVAMTLLPDSTAGAAPVDPKMHVPQLTWKADGKGTKRIYDGDTPIAALVEKPRALSLGSVKLVPGGPDFIGPRGGLWIAWRMDSFFEMVLDKVEADQSDPKRLKLHFAMHDSGLRDHRDPDAKGWTSAIAQDVWLEVSYDAERGSYVYDIRSQTKVRPQREEAFNKRVKEAEYTDPWPAGVFDRKNKRWSWFVYTGPDGKLYKFPHNHHFGPTQGVPAFGKDGILAYVVDPQHNPVFQMVGDTGPKTRGLSCWWAWDFHFYLKADAIDRTDMWTKPMRVHYRVFSAPEAVAKVWLDQAKLAPSFEDPLAAVPAFEIGKPNRFEPSDEYRKPSDRWFWQAAEPTCSWDLKTGCEGPGSLSIKRADGEGSSQWHFGAMGASYPPHPKLQGRYRVRAMVRTRDVTGKARLGWRFHVPVKGLSGVYTQGPMQYSTRSLSSTNDWTELVLETGETGGAILANVFLIQDGAGQSWFDDVEITPIQEK